MRSKEELKKDRHVSKELNKAVDTAIKFNKETGAKVFVFRRGKGYEVDFQICFEGEENQYLDSGYKIHVAVDKGVLVENL